VIADGRQKFGCGIDDFYRKPDIAVMLARRGVLTLPAATDIATEAPPALARVNPLYGVARWIADCPDCRVGVEYVWLDAPRFMCCNCGNRLIGGRWRTVKIPRDRKAIERELSARDDPETRIWTPGESLRRVRAENETLGIGA
jgi:hypothetical protein